MQTVKEICRYESTLQLLSLKVARSYLWDSCSSIPIDETNATEVAKVNTKINLACERFFTSGSWRGTLQRALITVYDGQVTLPRELQTILAAKFNSGSSARVNPIWYEFLPGTCGCSGTNGLTDLGEGFCTFRDIPSDLPVVVRSGEDITSTAVLTLVLKNADGVAQFDFGLGAPATIINDPLTGTILRASKPVTVGKILVYYKESGVETLILSMKPSETDANYRRYRVPSGVTSVDVMAKLCWLPASSDIEPIVPNNIAALNEMLLALQYRDKNDRERYKDSFEEAIKIANDDRQQFDGDNQTPIYQVTRGFGAADIPQIGAFGYRGDYVPGHYP